MILFLQSQLQSVNPILVETALVTTQHQIRIHRNLLKRGTRTCSTYAQHGKFQVNQWLILYIIPDDAMNSTDFTSHFNQSTECVNLSETIFHLWKFSRLIFDQKFWKLRSIGIDQSGMSYVVCRCNHSVMKNQRQQEKQAGYLHNSSLANNHELQVNSSLVRHYASLDSTASGKRTNSHFNGHMSVAWKIRYALGTQANRSGCYRMSRNQFWYGWPEELASCFEYFIVEDVCISTDHLLGWFLVDVTWYLTSCQKTSLQDRVMTIGL